MAAYDTFAAAADTNALKVVLEAEPAKRELHEPQPDLVAVS